MTPPTQLGTDLASPHLAKTMPIAGPASAGSDPSFADLLQIAQPTDTDVQTETLIGDLVEVQAVPLPIQPQTAPAEALLVPAHTDMQPGETALTDIGSLDVAVSKTGSSEAISFPPQAADADAPQAPKHTNIQPVGTALTDIGSLEVAASKTGSSEAISFPPQAADADAPQAPKHTNTQPVGTALKDTSSLETISSRAGSSATTSTNAGASEIITPKTANAEISPASPTAPDIAAASTTPRNTIEEPALGQAVQPDKTNASTPELAHRPALLSAAATTATSVETVSDAAALDDTTIRSTPALTIDAVDVGAAKSTIKPAVAAGEPKLAHRPIAAANPLMTDVAGLEGLIADASLASGTESTSASASGLALPPAPAGSGPASALAPNLSLTPAAQTIIAAPTDIPSILVTSVAGAEPGSDSVTIQLDPPELGRVSLDFKFDAQGLQTVSVSAETPEAMRRLRLMHSELVQALEQNGLSSDNLRYAQGRENDDRPERKTYTLGEFPETSSEAPQAEPQASRSTETAAPGAALNIKI